MPRSNRITLTPHIGGLVLNRPLDDMRPNTAIAMNNLIPDVDGDRLRPGYVIFAVPTVPNMSPDWGAAFISGEIKHLLVRNSADDTLYALDADANVIAGMGATDTDLTSTPFTNGAGGQILFICDSSSSDIATYDGTQFAPAGFSNPNNYILTNPLGYKNRMYFVRANSTQIYYGGVQAIAGALTMFDVSSFMQRGGSICGLANWRQNSSVGIQNTLAIFTTEGEVLVYSGTSPDASDWQLNGVYSIPRPIGNKFYENFAGDVFIATGNGCFMLSQIIPQDGQNISTVSDAVNPAFYNTQAIGIPAWIRSLGLLVVNYDPSSQYALCVRTGAWCRLVGYNTSAKFIELGDDVYFMDLTGIMKITPDGFKDNGADINYYVQRAYIKSDDGTIAQVLRVMPWVQSDTQIGIYKRIITDFRDATIGLISNNTTVHNQADWDIALWDAAFWANEGVLEKYKGVTTGYPARFNSVGYFGKSGQRLKLMGSEITFKVGTGDS